MKIKYDLQLAFDETGNFLYVLEEFAKSARGNGGVPGWVLDALQGRLEIYLDAGGGRSLDAVLGFRPRRGSTGAWDQKILRDRNNFLAAALLRIEAHGIPRAKAARLLSSILDRLPEGRALPFGFRDTLFRLSLGPRAIQDAVRAVEADLEQRYNLRAKYWSLYANVPDTAEKFERVLLRLTPSSLHKLVSRNNADL